MESCIANQIFTFNYGRFASRRHYFNSKEPKCRIAALWHMPPFIGELRLSERLHIG